MWGAGVGVVGGKTWVVLMMTKEKKCTKLLGSGTNVKNFTVGNP